MILFDFENVEKSYTVCPLSHSMGTVLRDPLPYATFSLRSLEGSHMTVSTVMAMSTSSRDNGESTIRVLVYMANDLQY